MLSSTEAHRKRVGTSSTPGKQRGDSYWLPRGARGVHCSLREGDCVVMLSESDHSELRVDLRTLF